MPAIGIVAKSAELNVKHLRLLLPMFVLSLILYLAAGFLFVGSTSSFFTHSGPYMPTSPQYLVGLLNLSLNLTLGVIVIVLLAIFISPLMIGMYMSLGSQALASKTGSVSLKRAFHAAVKKYSKFLTTIVVLAIIEIVAVAILLIPVYVGGLHLTTGFVSALLILLFAVLFTVYVSFTVYPVVMLEGKANFKAVKRAVEVAKKAPMTVLGILVIMAVLVVGVSAITGILLGLFQVLLKASYASYLTLFVHLVVNAFITSVFYISMVLFYREHVR